MQHIQNPDLHTNRYSQRFVTELLMAVIIIACSRFVQAQSITPPLPTFAPPTAFPVPYFCYCDNQIIVGDFNNDGKPDLAEISGYYAPSPVALYLNDGSGGFEPPITVIDVGAYEIGSADFNGDGNLDLVVTDGTYLLFMHGDGTGHFTQGPQIAPDSQSMMEELAVADFNHDNKPDILIRGTYFGEIFLGDGSAVNSSPTFVIGVSFTQLGLAIADFNGDGNLDLISADYGELLGDGAGNFQDPPFPSYNFGQYTHPYAVGDFNGDGKPDVATAQVTVHLGDGTGGFAPALQYQIGAQGYQAWDVKTADLNGDGKLDLVTVGAGRVFILLGNGDGTFGSVTGFPCVGTDFPTRLAVADFNGDSKPDIAVMGGSNADGQLQIFINTSYQTPVGLNSTVTVNNTTFTFDDVTAGGTTTVTPIDPASVGEVPGGFAVSNSVAYEIGTTASFTGSVTLAFRVPGPISQDDFNNLAILHNVNGTLVDVTASTPARDYSTLTIYATTSSFSPFYLARRGTHIKSLFDQTKAYKRGSTIPIKLQVQDASNTNVSSANTSLVTRDLRLMSGNTLAPIEDSGNANPDYSFRYDSTLGGTGGGYIFNLSTKGLASGQYVLSFYVGSDRSFLYTVKFEVK